MKAFYHVQIGKREWESKFYEGDNEYYLMNEACRNLYKSLLKNELICWAISDKHGNDMFFPPELLSKAVITIVKVIE
jgi:hypothetical protein